MKNYEPDIDVITEVRVLVDTVFTWAALWLRTPSS